MGGLGFLFFFFNWAGSSVGCYGFGCFCFHDLGRVLLVKGLLIISDG